VHNLLFITTDQQRQDSLPCYGLPVVRAPHLERLAAEGMVFERCYVSSPLCVPCRATLMTGQYAPTHGCLANFTWLSPDAWTWPRAAEQAGYRTAAIGKMHFTPWDLAMGWQQRIICEDKRHTYLPDHHVEFLRAHGLERPHPTDHPGYYESLGAPVHRFEARFHPDSFVAERAAAWIRGNAAAPFAVWVSFPGPHDPYDPPADYAALYANVEVPEPLWAESDARGPVYRRQHGSKGTLHNPMFRIDPTAASQDQIRRWKRHYYANITLIDEGIGRIVTALQESGILDRTLIIFASDHGDALGDHGAVYKGFYYESMVKVPLIARGPGVKRGRCASLVSTVDLVSTFLDWVGAAAPMPLAGRSLRPLFADPNAVVRDLVCSDLQGQSMVYDGRYKYVHYASGEREIYDHHADPDEFDNRAGSLPMEEHRLRGLMIEHLIDCGAAHNGAMSRPHPPERERLEAAYRRERGGGS
jgi:choline-sulfatase